MASTFVLDELDLDLASAGLLVCRLALFLIVVTAALCRVGVVDESVTGDDRLAGCSVRWVHGVGGVHVLRRSCSLTGVWRRQRGGVRLARASVVGRWVECCRERERGSLVVVVRVGEDVFELGGDVRKGESGAVKWGGRRPIKRNALFIFLFLVYFHTPTGTPHIRWSPSPANRRPSLTRHAVLRRTRPRAWRAARMETPAHLDPVIGAFLPRLSPRPLIAIGRSFPPVSPGQVISSSSLRLPSTVPPHIPSFLSPCGTCKQESKAGNRASTRTVACADASFSAISSHGSRRARIKFQGALIEPVSANPVPMFQFRALVLRDLRTACHTSIWGRRRVTPLRGQFPNVLASYFGPQTATCLSLRKKRKDAYRFCDNLCSGRNKI